MGRDIYGTLEAPNRKTIPWWLAGLCFLAGMLVVMGITILFLSAKYHTQYVPTPQNPGTITAPTWNAADQCWEGPNRDKVVCYQR